MLKKVIVAAALVIGAVAVSSADNASHWVSEFKASLQVKEAGIAGLEKIRDTYCSRVLGAEYREGCTLAYNVLILRTQAEQAELKLMLGAFKLSAQERDRILESVVPWQEFNRSDARTSEMQAHIRGIFSPRMTQR